MADPHSKNAGTEVELKLRVNDLAALMRICVAAGAAPLHTARQRNQYLDTAGKALDGKRFVFRLREETTPEASHVFLTAKGPAQKSADGTLSFVPEEEIEVAADVAAGIRAGAVDAYAALANATGATDARRALVQAMRDAAGGAPVVVVGEFVNERSRVDVEFPEGFSGVLELDRTTFPGDQVQHEVEFEVPAGVDPLRAKAAFEALFARAGVTGRAAPGKASRFFKALKGERLA